MKVLAIVVIASIRLSLHQAQTASFKNPEQSVSRFVVPRNVMILLCALNAQKNVMANTEVIKSFYDALDKGESEKAFRFLSEDFRLMQAESLPYGGVYEGKEELGLFFKKFGAVWSAVKSENVHYFSAGDIVVAKHDFVGTTKSGKLIKMPMIQLYWVKEGKIQKAEPFYKDTAQIMEIIDDP